MPRREMRQDGVSWVPQHIPRVTFRHLRSQERHSFRQFMRQRSRQHARKHAHTHITESLSVHLSIYLHIFLFLSLSIYLSVYRRSQIQLLATSPALLPCLHASRFLLPSVSLNITPPPCVPPCLCASPGTPSPSKQLALAPLLLTGMTSYQRGDSYHGDQTMKNDALVVIYIYVVVRNFTRKI